MCSINFKGSCLCGQVLFSVGGFDKEAANCHCTMCRKFHGAAFGTLVGVQDLVWLSGSEMLSDYTAPNGTTRTFCSVCGASLGFRVKDAPPERMELAISAFDEEIPVVIDAQIFTAYKAPWCELQDNLPVYLDGRSD